MNKKDLYVEKIFFAEFLAQPLIDLAQSIWTIAWYLNINEEDTPEVIEELVIGDKLLKLSKHIQYYQKPTSLKEAVELLNDFMLGKFREDRIRSKRVDIIKELNQYIGGIKG